MHGERGPINIPPLDDQDWGGGYLPHRPFQRTLELWRRKLPHYEALLRSAYGHERVHQGAFEEASENGSPLLRAMFYEFPEDPKCWELQDQYMFGDRYLVAPVFHLNQWQRGVSARGNLERY